MRPRTDQSTTMGRPRFFLFGLLAVVFVLSFHQEFRNNVATTAKKNGWNDLLGTTTKQAPPPPPQQNEPPNKITELLRLVREENRNVTRSGEKIFSHFLSHISKTGASFAMARLMPLMMNNDELWSNQNETDRFRPCNNMKSASTENFEKQWPSHFNGTRCTLWMSERPYTNKANHVYTIVRKPRSHVLSQYFHCTEAPVHRAGAHFMPATVDEWLEPYVHQVQNPENETSLPNFHCYNPINMQSRFAHFDRNTTKQELRERYDVIGDQSQMDKTVCMIFLRYTGHFAQQCNCSSSAQ